LAIPAIPAQGAPWLSYAQGLDAEIRTGRLSDATLGATYGTVLPFTDPRIGGKGDGTTDNTAAFNAALALLAPTGGTLFFPPGIYRINGATDPVPGGIWLVGTGYDYHTPSISTDRPVKHSVIRAGAAMTRLVQLGTDANVSTSGQTGASIEKLILDGNSLATTTLKLGARRNRVINSQIYGGTQTGVHVGGQNGHVIGCVVEQSGVGDVVLVQGFWDNKVWQNQLRGVGTTGACVRIVGAQNTDVQLNHMWAGADGVSSAAEGLVVVATPASDPNGITTHTVITDNTIESGQCPHVLIKSVSGGAIIRGVLINSNRFYQQTPFNDLQAPVVRFAGQGNISNVAVNDNMMTGIDNTHRYLSILDVDNTGPLQSANRVTMIGNSGTFVAALTTGSLPAGSTSLYLRGNYIQNGSASVLSDKTGRATFSGTGAQTAFTIPHGLASAPSSQRVVAGSAAAAGLFYVTADATNLTVTFTTAPATGTNNVVLNWQAEV